MHDRHQSSSWQALSLLLLCCVFLPNIGFAQSANRKSQSKPQSKPKLGIVGQPAPKWATSSWHQLPEGKKKLDIGDFRGKVVYLYFFQSWCPGCHKHGFPTLKKVSENFEDDDRVAFVAIQTTFEGHHINTSEKLAPTAKKHGLEIPFGQSSGSAGTPDLMRRYRSGGTPWVIIIDPKGRVVFNDFHIDPNKAVAGIKQLLTSVRPKASPRRPAEEKTPTRGSISGE